MHDTLKTEIACNAHKKFSPQFKICNRQRCIRTIIATATATVITTKLAGKCREKNAIFHKKYIMPSSRFLMISNTANTNNSSDSYRWANYIYIYNRREEKKKSCVCFLRDFNSFSCSFLWLLQTRNPGENHAA